MTTSYVPTVENLPQRFLRYFALAQKYGPLGTIRKVVSHTGLQIRATWWALHASRLPSEQAFMRRTIGKWKSLDELIEHLCSKRSPAFLFSAADREEYVTLLRQRYPANVEETLRRAEDICRHQFRFLGEDFKFTNEINWHFDPESGRSWPRDYFEKIDRWMWSGRRLGDYKLPWELNRHQYFVTLGKAYWLTGDEQYAEEFAKQVLSWIQHNPMGIGINWYSALEIGVRLISWALAFHFFRGSSCFIAQASKPFLKSLYQQARFLRDHLTLDREVRNNHIIGEVAALILIGSLFPEFKEAGEWLCTGLQVFEKELSLQTFPEGVDKEQATSYHRFVLDFLLLIVVLAQRGAIPASLDLEKLLEKMLTYVMYITTPDGNVSIIGDADDGRGYVFDESADFYDFRNWLAVGAVLFQRPDFKFVAQDFGEEAFWLLGPEGLRAFEQLERTAPKETSASFPQGGHYIIRDNWTRESDFALFKCGPFGLGGEGFCGHAHCDLLGFVLHIQGMSVIVDSGTYTYHGTWRDVFRLTAAHNTLMVDGHEQASPRDEFAWQDVPQAKCLAWEGERVVGAMQTAPGVWHRREVHHPCSGRWEVADCLEGEGIHELSWFFHFAPDLSLRWCDGSEHLSVERHGVPCMLIVPPAGVQVHIKCGWYSPSYGQKESNSLLAATWHGGIPIGGVRFGWKFLYVGEAEKKL